MLWYVVRNIRGPNAMSKLRTIRPAATIPAPEWLRDVAQALRQSRLSPHTKRTYTCDLRLFEQWLAKTEGTLTALTSDDVQTYKHYLKTTLRRRPATINHQLQAVRWLCVWAQRGGLLTANPALEVEAERVPVRRRPAGVAEGDIHRLFRAAGQARRVHRMRDYAVLQMLLQTGLRVGELVSLRIADIRLGQRSGTVRVVVGKGGKEREVPLNASARRALRAYLETRPDVEAEEPLFLSQQGRQLSVRMAEHLLQALSRRAKLEVAATPHRLRHAFAIDYLRQHPGNLVQLAHLLGHESIDTTAVYTQPSTEELAAQLESSPHNVFGR